jgi:oxygen-dependent protoporphyrinogen oxidase
MTQQIVVVGGGISGLATAYRLQHLLPTATITILEQATRAGGTIWTEERAGFRAECGPNGFLDNKPSTLSLCRDLGLGERLAAASEASGRNRYLFLDGRLRRLPSGFADFLATDLLSWRAKLNLLAERWRPKGRQSGDESVASFARRRAGREVADTLADAVVTGIHAGDPELLSLQAAFPRVAELEQKYGSVLKGIAASARERCRTARAKGEAPPGPSRMWSFREGLKYLIEALTAQLRTPPILGVTVRRLVPLPNQRWTVHGNADERWEVDAVILTCPAYAQAPLLTDVDHSLAQLIDTIAYNRVAVVALGFRQDDVPAAIDGFGYIAPQRMRRDLLGVQYCSSIFPERAPSGAILLRALCGGWHRPEIVSWDDDMLLNAVRAELRLSLGIQAAPIFQHIVRWDRAIPQYLLGHRERVAQIEARAAGHAGLYLGGNCYHGVALNDCTEQAEILAARVRDDLASSSKKAANH